MELNNDLITQFAKITKFNNTKSATTVRAKVVQAPTKDDSRTYIRIDGADEDSKTPAETVVEVSKDDRVIATVKDHSVVITGNKSNPAIGVKARDGLRSEITYEANLIRAEVADEVKGLNSTIELTAGEIRTEVADEVKGLNSTIELTSAAITSTINGVDNKYSSVKQTVDGLTVETVNGKTVIDGGNIKASSLNLTGAITWTDLDSDAKDEIENAATDAANSVTGDIATTANNALSKATAASINAQNALNAIELIPTYVTETKITKTNIESPTIIGGTFYAVGTSQDEYGNVTGKSTFSCMDGNGFYLYSDSVVADADNTKYPKISMMCSDVKNENPMLILGAGEADKYLYHNRFIIEKTSTYAWLEYHFDYSYPGCGITFHRNGNLYIDGILAGSDGKLYIDGPLAGSDGKLYIDGTLAGTTGLFPIGYIYISTDTTNPASLFGGTWDRLGSYVLATTDTNSAVGTTGNVVIAGGTNTAYSFKVAAWERVE